MGMKFSLLQGMTLKPKPEGKDGKKNIWAEETERVKVRSKRWCGQFNE